MSGPDTNAAVRIGGAGLVLGGLLILLVTIVLPAYSYGRSDITGEPFTWTWLDTFWGKGNDIAPVGAVALFASALAALVGGLLGLVAGMRFAGFLGAAIGLGGGIVTFLCGLVFAIMLVIDGDLERGSFGVWGLFPTGVICLAAGIVGFIGGLRKRRAAVVTPPGPPPPPMTGPPPGYHRLPLFEVEEPGRASTRVESPRGAGRRAAASGSTPSIRCGYLST